MHNTNNSYASSSPTSAWTTTVSLTTSPAPGSTASHDQLDRMTLCRSTSYLGGWTNSTQFSASSYL